MWHSEAARFSTSDLEAGFDYQEFTTIYITAQAISLPSPWCSSFDIHVSAVLWFASIIYFVW